MKTTLKFIASASLNYQKYDAEIVLELDEGEKLTPSDKEKYQKYVNDVACTRVTELAEMVEAVKNDNPNLNLDKKVVVPTVTPTPIPTPVPTPVSATVDLSALKAVYAGEKFVRGGGHTLGDANNKELVYIAGLTSKTYATMAAAAKQLLAMGYTGA